MQRAIDLAQNGLGKVSPNPVVGCVIVCKDKIIGEGWHQKFGDVHAEVNAINSVQNKNHLKNSTLYVTLEPCSHFGKTPPCADLIIKHKIPHVVICNIDPFEKVSGAGIQRLREIGIKVEIGILEQKGREVNRRFFTSIEKKRPYVFLKWAQTEDGFVARENFDSKWISNELSRKNVHKLRADEDAILVGFNTVKYDNPSLTVRDWNGNNPTRIIVDKSLSLDKSLKVFDQSVNTICFNEIETKLSEKLSYIKVDFNSLEEEILNYLYLKNIQSVIIEGGSKTLQNFIDKNLWDEAHVYIGEIKFNSGISAPIVNLEPTEEHTLLNDKLKIYRNVGSN